MNKVYSMGIWITESHFHNLFAVFDIDVCRGVFLVVSDSKAVLSTARTLRF